MARLPAVLDVLGGLGGHDRSTWDVFVRKLREAGELPPTKRGSGAIEIDAEQLAKILIAGMGTDSPARGPDVVRQLWSLPIADAIDKDELPATLAECDLETLGAGLTDILRWGRCIMIELSVSGLPEDQQQVALYGDSVPDEAFDKRPVDFNFAVNRSANAAQLIFVDLFDAPGQVEAVEGTRSIAWMAEEDLEARAWNASITIDRMGLWELSGLVQSELPTIEHA